jgi:Holliday junction resolvase YEN1
MKNADGKVDDKHVRLYSAQDIEDHPNIQLTQGGCILIGLMSGGDYNTVSWQDFSASPFP